MMKKWMKQLTGCVLVLVLVLGLVGCGGYQLDQNPGQTKDPTSNTEVSQQDKKENKKASKKENKKDNQKDLDVETTEDSHTDLSKYKDKDNEVKVPVSNGSQSGKDEYETDPVPEGQQMPVEPEDAVVDEEKPLTCYMTISCATILDNMDQLKDGKEVLVPSNGVLFARQPVTFYAGESAFDVLQRVTRNNRIHMESRFTPAYNSAYICGIGNLYEFDCGPSSGWMYCVNGWYPNYGVSRYVLQDQDEVQFNYTCDLGRDLGGNWQG